MRTTIIATLASAALLSGCATMVGSPMQMLPISSVPSEAKVSISDETGMTIFTGNTPTTVTLHKSTGKYFGGKSFEVTIAKSGYVTQVIPVTSQVNGWYIGGNFIFGGLVGWLIVDPLNGHMYTLTPETINATLGSTISHNNQSGEGISIMLVQDVPSELKPHMQRVQ